MPAIEIKPLGNEWEFSDRNAFGFGPGPNRIEIIQPIGLLQEVIQHVQGRFIRPEWSFAALVQGFGNADGSVPSLIAIFTHPSRTDLLPSFPVEDDIRDFIKPEVYKPHPMDTNRSTFWSSPRLDDPLNQMLRGTNFYTYRLTARYNEVSLGGYVFSQTGVGRFNMSFLTTEKLTREGHLAVPQVPNPRQLFTPSS